ncbi:glycosyltransferase [candidate division KSB1 bacterium]|nr:glycosyltransferase [candidate division KSB1 bacterium]
MKKVLIIAYYFPPSGGAGVQRTLKFVKYLPEFGWQPLVLSAENADYPALDESLLAEIPPDTPVYRSKIVEPYSLYRRLTGQKGAATDIAVLSRDPARPLSTRERLSELIRSTFFIPDARIGWYPFAVSLGKKIIAREKIDLIYSSAPPYTTHLIGRALHRSSRLPWVADFRDSWIGWLSAPQWRPGCSRALEKWMERVVLRDSNRILAVSAGVKADLLSRQPDLKDERWEILTNGYDSRDLLVPPVAKSDRLTITYTGSLYGHRNPETLVAALEMLHEESPCLAERIQVRLIGRIAPIFERRIESSTVQNRFTLIPYLSHSESLSYLKGTDLALLIIDDAPANRGILTGKLFEYIGAGRPVLALAPEGDAADLIRSNGFGCVVHPQDKDHLLAVLREFAQKWPQPPLQAVAAERTRPFERRRLTECLASIFNSMIPERPTPAPEEIG